MVKIVEKPTIEIAGVKMSSVNSGFCVEALNNDISTFHDVLKVFVQVCLYDAREAKHYTSKIHNEGRAVCYWGSKEECELVIAAFKSILVECRLLEN